MKTYFDHEKLDVYQEAIAFCGWIGELLSQISAKAAAKDHLDRASTSLPLNIAQGNGKFSTVELHASMCLPCESLLLLNGSFLPRKGSFEQLTCSWEC